VLIGLVGVLVPVIVQFYQNRILKIESETLANFLRDELNKVKIELSEQTKSEMERQKALLKEKIEEIETELKTKISAVKGVSFHVQGLLSLTQEKFSESLEVLTTAASFYLEGEDELNLRRVLIMIAETCLPEVTKKDLSPSPRIEKNLQSLVKELESKNINNRYFDLIHSISTELQLAKERDSD